MPAEHHPQDQPDSLLSGVVIGLVVAVLLLAGVVLVVGQLLPGSNDLKIAFTIAWFVLAGALLARVGKARPGLRVPLRAGVALASVALLGWYANSLRGNEVQEQLVDAAPVAEASAATAPTRSAPRPAATKRAAASDRKPSSRRPRARSRASRAAKATTSAQSSSARQDPRPAEKRSARPAATAAPTTAAKPTPRAATKAAPKPAAPGLVAAGAFAALEHDTSGQAEIIRAADGKQQLQLRSFKTDAGPDLKVYLATDTGAGDFVDLGKLKGNTGNQVYALPGAVDLKKYDTVLIWCRAFTVGFGKAALK